MARAFRCVWTLKRSGDCFIGDLWDRESAEWVAAMLRRKECVTDVEIVAWGELQHGD